MAREAGLVVRATLWGVWAVATIAGLAYVGACGRNVPVADEWLFLRALDPDHPLLPWLFERHVDHVYPIPRLMFVGLFRFTGDLRSAMVLSVVFLSTASAILMGTARRLRGRSSLADALFPLVLLHGGHWENLLMAYQVNFTGGVLLICVLLDLAARPPRSWTRGQAARGAAAAVLLPGFGALGLVFGGAAGLWLTFAGLRIVRRTSPRAGYVVAAAGTLAGIEAALGVLLQGPSPFADLPRRTAHVIGAGLRLPAETFGTGLQPHWMLVAVLAAFALPFTAAALMRSLRSGVRGDSAGLALLSLAGLALCAGLAWGRSWAGPDAMFASRYSVILAPLLFALVLLILKHGSPSARFVPAAAAALAAVAWPMNALEGAFHGLRMGHHQDALLAEHRAGWPAEAICSRHDFQTVFNHPLVFEQFPLLERFPDFRSSRGSRHRIEAATDGRWTLAGTGGATADGRLAAGPAGSGFRIEFAPNANLAAIRLTGEFEPHTLNVTRMRARWRDSRSGEWREERFALARAVSMSFTVGAAGPVAEVELIPDTEPWSYRVLSVEWLLDCGEQDDRDRSAAVRP